MNIAARLARHYRKKQPPGMGKDVKYDIPQMGGEQGKLENGIEIMSRHRAPNKIGRNSKPKYKKGCNNATHHRPKKQNIKPDKLDAHITISEWGTPWENNARANRQRKMTPQKRIKILDTQQRRRKATNRPSEILPTMG